MNPLPTQNFEYQTSHLSVCLCLSIFASVGASVPPLHSSVKNNYKHLPDTPQIHILETQIVRKHVRPQSPSITTKRVPFLYRLRQYHKLIPISSKHPTNLHKLPWVRHCHHPQTRGDNVFTIVYVCLFVSCLWCLSGGFAYERLVQHKRYLAETHVGLPSCAR